MDTVLNVVYAKRSATIFADLKLTSRYDHSTGERLLLVVGLAVSPIMGWLPASLGDPTLVYMCCMKCQFILVVGGILMSLSRWNMRYWGGLGTSACLVGHIVSQMLALYCANAVAAGDRTQAARLMWASFAIQVATVFVFFFMTCRWVYASIQAMAGTAVAPATRYRVFF